MKTRSFQLTLLQGGDDYLLVDYGHGAFDLNHRSRVTAMKKHLTEATGDITFSTGLISTVGCGNCKSTCSPFCVR